MAMTNNHKQELRQRMTRFQLCLEEMRKEAKGLVSSCDFTLVKEYVGVNGVIGLYRGRRGSVLMIRTEAVKEHKVVTQSQETDLVNWFLAIGHFADALEIE